MQPELAQLEAKLRDVERRMEVNVETVNQIKGALRDIIRHGGSKADWRRINALVDALAPDAAQSVSRTSVNVSALKPVVIPTDTCSLADTVPHGADIQVTTVFLIGKF